MKIVDKRKGVQAHRLGEKKSFIQAMLSCFFNGCLICFILMNISKLPFDKPNEGVEPLKDASQIDEVIVDVMKLSDMCGLMQEDHIKPDRII